VTRSDTEIEIDTGAIRCRIGNWGDAFIESIETDGREVARRGQLVCILQSGPDGDPVEAPARENTSDMSSESAWSSRVRFAPS